MQNSSQSAAHVLTVAATGASGAEFTRALLLLLERDARVQALNFIASNNALRVFAEELEIKSPTIWCTEASREKIEEESGSRTLTTLLTLPVVPTARTE